MDQDAKDWLGAKAPVAVQLLAASDSHQGQLSFERISCSEGRHVYRIDLNGRLFIAKSFEGDIPNAKMAFEREVFLLSSLEGSNLAPDLLGKNSAHRLVVMEHVHGATVAESLTNDSLVELCCRIGQWHAQFDHRVKHLPCESNWADYLSNYPDHEIEADLTSADDWLRRMPIRDMAIAKNDAFFGNFLQRDDGRLIGIDFEAAVMKPVGWDILLLARQLRRDHPAVAQHAIAALLRGWGRGTESLGPAKFADLALWFADATRHLGPPS